ncbi:TylF/MycF/NovP-related O-methyltransferase [Tabrizicola sp.]|uniref:TylF/MycF/NovP-related O-methyltransferase n=1 Tax=Tabrizicola sp. TaxID=2005166 RepID=UPI0025E02D8C|nr:TylF/MycF/NovP-related O-methyltransferase [Tabrizicola sp.]
MGVRRELRKVGKLFGRSESTATAIPNERLGYDGEADALLAIPRVRSRTMVAHASLLSLWAQIRHCELKGLPGAYVECGVWKGGVGGLMALANMAYGADRRPIHLFDIFDDICEPDPAVDGERALTEVEQFAGRSRASLSGKMQPLSGVYDHIGGPGDAEAVQKFVAEELGYGTDFTRIHKGWFEDTVPIVTIGPIAILRLDGDWYASTKLCLDHLYDAVVPGGFVIVDDYGTYEGCRKAVDEFLAMQPEQPFLNYVTADVRYWIKPAGASLA